MESAAIKTTNPYYHYENIWKSERYKTWEQGQSEDFKAYRSAWENVPRTHIPPAFPISINVEITNICNVPKDVWCTHCPKHFYDEEQKHMTTDDVKAVLKEAYECGAKAVNLNGAGESMTHPDFIEMIKYAKSLGYLDIMFHTNAIIMPDKKARELIESGLTRIIFSVETHDEDVFKEIRPGIDFHKVRKNIEKFIRIRNEMGSVEPMTRATIVVTKFNAPTIAQTIDYWKICDYITINDCMYWDNLKAFAYDPVWIEEEAKRQGLVYVCAPLFQQLSVTQGRKVIACSTTYAKNAKPLGYWGQQSLKEIWEGTMLAAMRKAHLGGKCGSMRPCSDCDLPKIELLKQLRGSQKVMIS